MADSIHDLVRKETDAALWVIRTDIQNLEQIYIAEKEKTIGIGYETKRAKEILEGLKEHVEDLDTAIKKLSDSVSDLPLIRKIVYYPFGLVLAAFILWALSKIGLGGSK